MLNILARARRYQGLTPAERALLRLLEGLASVDLVGAATAAARYLASPAGSGLGAVSWPTIARVRRGSSRGRLARRGQILQSAR